MAASTGMAGGSADHGTLSRAGDGGRPHPGGRGPVAVGPGPGRACRRDDAARAGAAQGVSRALVGHVSGARLLRLAAGAGGPRLRPEPRDGRRRLPLGRGRARPARLRRLDGRAGGVAAGGDGAAPGRSGARDRSPSMSRLLERPRSLLQRPGAWLDQANGAYPLRLGGDRRSRVVLALDEAVFRAVIVRPGLRLRQSRAWPAPAANDHARPAPPPGRPGAIEGERAMMEGDGRLTCRRANRGESPILWLARRKDQSGRSWLTPAEVAAGERLRAEAEIAAAGPSLTMRWD